MFHCDITLASIPVCCNSPCTPEALALNALNLTRNFRIAPALIQFCHLVFQIFQGVAQLHIGSSRLRKPTSASLQKNLNRLHQRIHLRIRDYRWSRSAALWTTAPSCRPEHQNPVHSKSLSGQPDPSKLSSSMISQMQTHRTKISRFSYEGWYFA